MKKHIIIEPSMGLGGVMLIDESCVRGIEEAEVYNLSVAMDVDGVTDLKHDFQGERWADVWSRVTKELAKSCVDGRFALCILRSGLFYADICDEDKIAAPDCFLKLPTGKLCVIEIETFAEQFFSGKLFKGEVIAIEPGEYSVRFSKNANAIVDLSNGIFGNETEPAMNVSIALQNEPVFGEPVELMRIVWN